MHQVLVLNASYEPLNVCSDRRAHVLVWKGKAEIVEHHGAAAAIGGALVRSPARDPPAPVRSCSPRREAAGSRGVPCLRATAGSASTAARPAARLTLDHVIPRSKGGDSVWENVVTACAPCNLRKGDRLLEEVAMSLPRPPRAPAPVLFIRLAAQRVPESWRQYLPSLEQYEHAAA